MRIEFLFFCEGITSNTTNNSYTKTADQRTTRTSAQPRPAHQRTAAEQQQTDLPQKQNPKTKPKKTTAKQRQNQTKQRQ